MAACLLVAGLLAAPARAAQEARPNILFLFSDDHATQAISAYGSQLLETPHLDRIAREGIVFDRSYCANSLCGPSRACILTGKHSHRNGFRRNGERFDPDQFTFPPLLQQAGYQTAVIGKWHLSSDPVGFDHWAILPGQGSYYNPDFLEMDGRRTQDTGYCTDVITDRALEWLEHGRDPDRPFLLMCQHKAPHRNWAPASRHLALWDDVPIPEPATLLDTYAGRTSLLRENEMSLRDHLHWGHDMKFHGENEFPEYFQGAHGNGEYARMNPEQRAAWDAHYEPRNQAFLAQLRAGELGAREVLAWKYQRYIKDYLRCIVALDEGVGRVLDYLDASGLAENTLVIYSSDQGFYLGEHGWYDKRWMFEESLRMPFLARWPGVIPAGSRSDALIQNIDYAPTFLEIAGQGVPDEVQGRSLLPLLRAGGEGPPGWRDAIYYAYYENAAVHNVPVHDGVRTARHKLMFFPRTREWQLFDLSADPSELRSLHDDPDHAALLAGMQQRYRTLRQTYQVNSAVIPTTRGDEAWWRERDQAVRAAARERGAGLVFLGDSITQGWEGPGRPAFERWFAPRRALNLGFSGDRTEHLLWRVLHGELEGLQPAAAAVLIGTNNTGHLLQDPAEVAAGIDAILEVLRDRLPETEILLHAVFPRGREPDDPMRRNTTAINEIIRRWEGQPKVHFVDLSTRFLAADGRLPADLMPDALHLSAAGYDLWAEALDEALRALGQ